MSPAYENAVWGWDYSKHCYWNKANGSVKNVCIFEHLNCIQNYECNNSDITSFNIIYIYVCVCVCVCVCVVCRNTLNLHWVITPYITLLHKQKYIKKYFIYQQWRAVRKTNKYRYLMPFMTNLVWRKLNRYTFFHTQTFGFTAVWWHWFFLFNFLLPSLCTSCSI